MIEGAKQQIRGLVEEITQLCKQDLEPEVFFGEFLQRIVTALAAVGGAVWTLTADRQLQLAFQINLRESSLGESGEDQRRHTRLLGRVLRDAEPLLVAPQSGTAGDEEAGNPTGFLLVLSPLKSGEQVEGVVEVFQRPGSEPVAQQGFLRFVAQMCELAGNWLKSRQLRHFGDQQTLWMRVDEFTRSVHESLDPVQTAYTIANEGRRLIGCDRVSVAASKGRRYRVTAVSGQDTFDKRSNTVVLLGRLATVVVATGEPLWYDGSDEDLPPQIEEAIQNYVDESHTKAIAVLPLRKPVGQPIASEEEPDQEPQGDVVGALIVEQIEDTRPRDTFSQRVDLVCEHGSRALANATEHNNLFLMPLWRTLGRARWLVKGKTLPKTVSISAAILVLLVALFAVRIDFDLEGRGVLQPVERRDVFVNTPGVVTEVLVESGALVQKDQPLVKLRNTDLDLQQTDALGRRQTTRAQLRSVQRGLMDKEHLSDKDRNQLFGQQRQLEQRLLSLDEQIKLIAKKRQQLIVTSPIAGEVITWNVEKQLRHRPVMAGQVLMTVANPKGDWELEVFMPENRMGHVTRAGQAMEENEDLQVTYVMATDPGTSHEGKVLKIHEAAELHEEDGQSVRIRVEIDKSDLTDPRPGATAAAKVHCGRGSIIYVWGHELVEFIQARILF